MLILEQSFKYCLVNNKYYKLVINNNNWLKNMGRVKEFDREEVLHIAMEQFWSKGFDGTSMIDLTTAMKISPQSLYNTFGSKENLFLSTMDLFTRISEQGFGFTLKSKKDASLPEIIKHFSMSRKFQFFDDEKQSCYISNCALELGSSSNYSLRQINSEVINYTNKFFTLYKDAFKFAVFNGIKKGEIGSHHDPESTALFLLNSITGLGIFNKSRFTHDQIDKMIITTLSIFKNFKKQDFVKYNKEMENMNYNLLL
jgi:TetR/AcrR family transcriptional repressor of nem operon